MPDMRVLKTKARQSDRRQTPSFSWGKALCSCYIIPIKPPSERIKKLAFVNDWDYGLLSRAMAVIGPHKTEDEVLLALQEAADNINLADLRATAVIGPHDAADNISPADIRGGGADHPNNQALKLKGAKVFGYRSVAEFDKALARPFPGYHHGRYPLAVDAQSEPPPSHASCGLKVGDVVTFTNENGVEFPHQVVTGFAPEAEHGRFVYFSTDAWWFPVEAESLKIEPDPEDGLLEKKAEDTTMVVVDTAEGQLLDWLVAKAVGEIPPTPVPSYSTDPTIGGSLILGSPIEIRHRPTPWNDVEATWCEGTRINQFGPNPLIAGLRAYVSGQLGVEVNVPNHVLANLQPQNVYYVWCDDDCANKTSSLDEAKGWRDQFLNQGRDAWIVDQDNNYIADGELPNSTENFQ